MATQAPLNEHLNTLAQAAKTQREGAAQAARAATPTPAPVTPATVILDSRGLPTSQGGGKL